MLPLNPCRNWTLSVTKDFLIAQDVSRVLALQEVVISEWALSRLLTMTSDSAAERQPRRDSL